MEGIIQHAWETRSLRIWHEEITRTTSQQE